MFSRYHIRPQHIVEFGSTQLIKESVEAGLGVTRCRDGRCARRCDSERAYAGTEWQTRGQQFSWITEDTLSYQGRRGVSRAFAL